MTQTSPTQTPDEYTATLAATDEYGQAASTTAHQYAMVDLTPEQLDEYIAKLTAARAVLTR